MKTNILTLAITLTLGVILAGSLLMPVISDAQKEVAEKVTYTNESAEYLSLSDGDVDITLNSGVLTINDAAYTTSSSDVIIFLSDYFALYNNGTNYYATYLNQNSGVRNVVAVDISVVSNVLTASVTYDNSATQTAEDINLKFSFYVDPNGNYARFTSSAIQPYVTKMSDVVAGGSFYTGTNKTYYWYYEGEAGGYSDDYTYDFNATLTLVEGTYDIYTISNCKMSIDNEEFTPYHMIVKKEVSGTAEKGAAYSLFGAIPIIVIIGLVLAATAAIFSKRED